MSLQSPHTELTSFVDAANEPRSVAEGNPYLESDHKHSVPRTKQSARALVYLLQAAARELLPDSRVAWCMRRFQPGRQTVDIMHSEQRQTAYYHGLMRCNLIHECPVCGRKITETRRERLSALIEANKVPVIRAGGGVFFVPRYHLSMLTFTISHRTEESCDTVLDRLTAAYKRFSSGRWYQGFKARFFVVGSLRALELTHGYDAGWHPHYHILHFHDSHLTEQMQIEYLWSARQHWADSAAAVGGYADATYGVELTVGDHSLYAQKVTGDREVREWGLAAEVTKQPVKRGRGEHRSLTDLLIAYVNGDVAAGILWTEAVGSLSGRKHLYPSKGLWTLLQGGIPEDAEAATDDVLPTDRILASLTWDEWRCVLRQDARAQLLDIAADGDEIRLWEFLESLGVDKKLQGVTNV